jgi:glycosyltransferase involved in cell wall biosynthesis
MTVVVNAVGIKMGGAINVLRNVSTQLATLAPQHRFVFYIGPEVVDVTPNPSPNICWRVTPAGAGGGLRRLWWDQITLRGRLAVERADALLSFADFAQLACRVPQLLHLQNSIYFSELFSAQVTPQKDVGFRLVFRLRCWLARQSVRAADAIMTPSATMLEMVRREVPLPEGKGEANHYGAPAQKGNEETLPRDYNGTIRLLFPTFYADHKNFGTALEALRLLRQRHGARFRLVTTADPRWELAWTTAAATRNRDRALLDELSHQGVVELVGLLPHEQLLALYRECHIMCYPTLTESFGHPLLEALQAGLPVVASDIPVNRELARDAALYFDPLDPAQLAARVEEVADHPTMRASMQERGCRYAAEFSWTRHAEKLLHRLEALANQRSERPPAGLNRA